MATLNGEVIVLGPEELIMVEWLAELAAAGWPDGDTDAFDALEAQFDVAQEEVTS